MLLEQNVYPTSNASEWQEFRELLMYNVECNDVFVANIKGLGKIYNLYTNPMQKYMTFEDSIDLFTYRSDLKLSRKELTYCYGMCKMSVPLENELGQTAKYQKL